MAENNELQQDKVDIIFNPKGKTAWEKTILPNKEAIMKMYSQGAGDFEVWTTLKLSKALWYDQKKKHPEIEEWISESRSRIVGLLKSTLFKRAMGFTYEEKITEIKQDINENGQTVGRKYMYQRTLKHYSPPDVNAIYGCLKIFDKDNSQYDIQTKNVELKKQELEMKKKLLLPEGEADKDLIKKLENFKIEIVDASKKDGEDDKGN